MVAFRLLAQGGCVGGIGGYTKKRLFLDLSSSSRYSLRPTTMTPKSQSQIKQVQGEMNFVLLKCVPSILDNMYFKPIAKI